MKYGLMCYNYTTNLGNEIQSIAARRFLPKIDYYIEHEKLERFDEDTDVNMIMNGWFLDCAKAWPPSDNINPLLISMHFSTTTTEERKDAILTDESKDFFSKNGPVGCRDFHTVEFLKDNGIDAYYSGCLTLTLDSGDLKLQESDDEYIVINVENPSELYGYLKEKTDKRILIIYQDMIPSFKKAYPKTMKSGIYTLTSLYNWEEKFFMAENLLKIYENASCVITDRLHCALPCLAFKTPALLLKNERLTERFNGIDELLQESTLDEYFDNYNIFDVDNPNENPKEYLKIRKDLIGKCEKFTGTVNNSCYRDIPYQRLLESNSLILSKNAMETRKYIEEIVSKYRRDVRKLKRKIKKQEKKIESMDNSAEVKRLKSIIKEQEKKIEEMEASNSWTMSKPLQNLKRKLK